MGALWTQNGFPGAAGVNLSAVAPSYPTSPAGAYTYTTGSTAVVDGNGNVYNPGSAIEVLLTNWLAPTPKVFTLNLGLWKASAGAVCALYVKFGNDANNYYAAYFESDSGSITLNLYKIVGGVFPSPSVTASIALAANATQSLATGNMTLIVDESVAGATTITLNAGVNGGAQSQKYTWTDSSGVFGMGWMMLTLVGGDASFRISYFDIVSGSGAAALTVGNLGDTTPTGALAATVTCPVPAGGGGSYTYQWYSSASANFAIGAPTIIGGATSPILTLSGLTANSNLWVACRVSDGTTTADTFKRLVRLSGQPPIVYGVIGDSTSVTSGGGVVAAKFAPSHAAYLLRSRFGVRQVILVNRAISGTATIDWQAGGANMTAALAAIAAAVAANPTAIVVVELRLGANDAQAAVSAATFATQYANTLGALTGAGYKVLLSYPTWREPGLDLEIPTTLFDESYTPLMLAYLPDIDSLVNGSSVFAGDRNHFYIAANQPSVYGDNSVALPGFIHPGDIGAEVMGIGAGFAALAVTNPVSGGTVVGARRRPTRGRS